MLNVELLLLCPETQCTLQILVTLREFIDLPGEILNLPGHKCPLVLTLLQLPRERLNRIILFPLGRLKSLDFAIGPFYLGYKLFPLILNIGLFGLPRTNLQIQVEDAGLELGELPREFTVELVGFGQFGVPGVV